MKSREVESKTHDYGILRALGGGGVMHFGISKGKGGLKHGSRPCRGWVWIFSGIAHYMAARGYKFYLRVLKVSVTPFHHEKIKFVSPSGHVMFCLFYT